MTTLMTQYYVSCEWCGKQILVPPLGEWDDAKQYEACYRCLDKYEAEKISQGKKPLRPASFDPFK